jgi:hypothetical protein
MNSKTTAIILVGYRVSILSDGGSFHTQAKPNFFGQPIFPLDGGVLDNRQLMEQLSSATI